MSRTAPVLVGSYWQYVANPARVVCVVSPPTGAGSPRLSYEPVDGGRRASTWLDRFLAKYEPVKREPAEDILVRLRSNARQGLVTVLLPHEARAIARVARGDSVSTSPRQATMNQTELLAENERLRRELEQARARALQTGMPDRGPGTAHETFRMTLTAQLALPVNATTDQIFERLRPLLDHAGPTR
jgi:hypothetical protein